MIVGIAVPTMLRSSAARAMAAMIPTVTNAWLRVMGGIGAWAARAVDVMRIECRSGPRTRALRHPGPIVARWRLGRREMRPLRDALARARDVAPRSTRPGGPSTARPRASRRPGHRDRPAEHRRACRALLAHAV